MFEKIKNQTEVDNESYEVRESLEEIIQKVINKPLNDKIVPGWREGQKIPLNLAEEEEKIVLENQRLFKQMVKQKIEVEHKAFKMPHLNLYFNKEDGCWLLNIQGRTIGKWRFSQE